MRSIACYISGHGFGHAVRVMEVLQALWRLDASVRVHIRTSVPRWLFDFTLSGRFTYAYSRLDVGAVQSDSLTLDAEATLRACGDLNTRRAELMAAERAALAPLRPDLVFADIPALAFDIAEDLRVPGVAMSNFSWDWIYADYASELPAFAAVVEDLRRSYGRATLLLRLPMHGDLGAFPRVRDIPLVARRAGIDPAEVKRRLDLPQGALVLLSFGGIGLAFRRPPQAPPGIAFAVTESGMVATPPPGCRVIANREMSAAGVRYEDLVGASAAVMTKPGYGIVAECIANGTPIVYTSRGRFAEYECLVQGIERCLPNRFLSNEDLHAGRWSEALRSVLSQPRPAPAIRIDGAEVAAQALLDFLR